MASACLHVSLTCVVLGQIMSLRYLSRSSLHRLAGLLCHIFLSCGLQVVTPEVHQSYVRRLMCPAKDQLIFLALMIMSMNCCPLSVTQMLVLPSLYAMVSMLLSFLASAAARLFCACLVSVEISAPCPSRPHAAVCRPTPVSSGRWSGCF